MREGLLWLSFSVAAILFLSLLSYSPSDPSFTFASSGLQIHNWMGPFGAWTSDLLFLLWGWSAYLLPAGLAGLGLLIHKPPILRSRRELWLRTGGGIVTVIALSGFFSNWHPASVLPAGPGGVIGFEVAYGSRAVLNPGGTALLLVALILAGVSLSTRWSWLGLLRWSGEVIRQGGHAFWVLIARLGRRPEAPLARPRPDPLDPDEPGAPRSEIRIEPTVGRVEPGLRLETERQQILFKEIGGVERPPLTLLDTPTEPMGRYSEQALSTMSQIVELKLKDFGIAARVIAVTPGPVVTRFELEPAPGVKVSQITSLVKDLARALSVVSVRVVENIPGKSAVGLEVPNEKREIVTLGEILCSRAYESASSPLTLALGKDISGQPVVTDLERMPHLLIAGTTGSGKSVALNAMILSLLYKSTPEQIRLILVDPKMLELSVYQGVPHLLTPVVTDSKETRGILRWAIREMERRYQLMAAHGVRSLAGYNRKVHELALEDRPGSRHPGGSADSAVTEGKAALPETLPHIVMVVDELADLMLALGKKVDELFARLAQKARASGIHLILATQRPSVDVITGLIKANIPARIAFQITSKTDSRIILDQNGAEALLGNGDMLFLPPGQTLPQRVHGAYVSDSEVHRVVNWLRQAGSPQYIDMEMIPEGEEAESPLIADPLQPAPVGDTDDECYPEAVRLVLETRRASVSMVQRRFRIGYNRAARLVERMEKEGLVGPLQSNGFRQVLVPSSHGE